MSEQVPANEAADTPSDPPTSDFGSSVFGVVTSGTPEAGERPRLAAMVFTDVVGYSKRMGENEEETIAAVHADFTRMRELCAKYGGEVLNTMGDGMMLSFDGAVAAMKFALEMQTENAERNGKMAPGKGLQHRIGIHIGDVYRVLGGHMAGDGVNIAARLEPKAPHGGVAISQIVYDTVKGKVQMKAERMGPQTFKNISQPIVVWKITVEDKNKPVPTPAPVRAPEPATGWPWLRRAVWIVVLLIAGDLLWPYRDLIPDSKEGLANFIPSVMQRIRGGSAPGTPVTGTSAAANSIAVLPFTDRPDKDGGFADGLQDDLARRLALLGELKVVSSSSTLPYRGTSKPLPQVAKELGVAQLVVATAQREGGKLKVQAQLVKADSDKPVWSQSFERDAKELAAVQGQLALSIATALKLQPTQAVQIRLARPPTDNPQAWELYLRHQALVQAAAASQRPDLRNVESRGAMLTQAVGLDPRFALAWAGLAMDRAEAVRLGLSEAEMRAQAQKALAQAQTLAPDDVDVRLAEGAVRLDVLRDPAKALQSFESAARARPGNVDAAVGAARVHGESTSTSDALTSLEQALKADPRNAAATRVLAQLYEHYRLFPQAQSLRGQLADHYSQDPGWHAQALRGEYVATGSWASWDKWRADAGKGLEARLSTVRDIAVDRAAAARDFAEVRRLLDLQPEDLRGGRSAPTKASVDRRQALAFFIAGDRARATQAARAAMAGVEADLQKAPREELLYDKAVLLALQGQKAQALAAAGDAVQMARKNGDRMLAEVLGHRLVAVQALLGDKAAAIEELRKRRGRIGFLVRDMAADMAFAPLWDEADFKALLGDPASSEPIPLKNRAA